MEITNRNVVTTVDGKRYQKASNMQSAGAGIVGLIAAGSVKDISNFTSSSALNSMKNMCKDSIDVETIKNAAKEAINLNGLRDKVDLLDINNSSSTVKCCFQHRVIEFPLVDAVDSAADSARKVNVENFGLKKAVLQELPQKFRRTKLGKIYTSILEKTFANGNNAAFFPKSNKIAVNFEKLGYSVFHEIGHSINKNCSKFWNVLQKSRTPFMLLGTSVIPLIAIFKRKKVEGEEPKNVVDKVTTFVKNNGGKLATLSFVPMVAEELKATARGNKLAKQLLNPAAYKKVLKSNRLGALTYIITALGTGLGVFIGSEVKDLLTKPKEVKA